MKIYASKVKGSGITVGDLYGILSTKWAKVRLYDQRTFDNDSYFLAKGRLDQLMQEYPELANAEIYSIGAWHGGQYDFEIRIIPSSDYPDSWMEEIAKQIDDFNY